ncbi:DUF6380 family protein [Streptomyces sp. NPDC006235]|uniref:DUF6380 family protein n=1 Tax=Streptomyces sp. NPDC006235 TaxID=3156736 RepID=UPI0033AC8B98
MTDGPIQGDATGDRAHARRAGAGLRGRATPETAVLHAPHACREVQPVPSLASRRGRVAVVGAGPGGCARVAPTAGRGHDAPLGQTVADNRWATLRRGVASLTETVGRASFERYGRRTGEGAR